MNRKKGILLIAIIEMILFAIIAMLFFTAVIPLKAFIALLLLAAVLFGLVFVLPAPAARAEEQEVTILVYICGSDLESKEGEASTDIREMVSSGIGSSGEVTVLLATGGASRWSGYDISARNVQYYRLEKSGTELERLRARQMREMVKQGPLTTIVPELVQTVLESITVKGGGAFEIRFVDGTEFRMKF